MSTCPLTETQVKIVQRLADGAARKAIAYELSRNILTIHQHIKNAHHRAGTATTYELIAEAVRNGWVQ